MKGKGFKKFINRFDSFRDPKNDRGGSKDITTRMLGNFILRYADTSNDLYYANGFLQTIVDTPAYDATREWFTIKTNQDTEDSNISRLIELRLQELEFKKKLRQLVSQSRKHQKGGFMYYGIKADNPQLKLEQPIEVNARLDYLNIIEDPETVSILINNRTDGTKKDYLKPSFRINGTDVHESRLSWLIYNFDSVYMRGQTPLDKSMDAIMAQDSALWSMSKLMTDIVTKVFKSDMFVALSAEKKIEFLEKMKHYMETNGSVALTKNEEFEKLTYSFSGINEIFDFIFDNLAGISGIPKNILLGKSHGVVTAGEYDTLNYYAFIAKLQENELTPIVKKVIDMIIREKRGIGSMINPDKLDYEVEWNTLWRLDPLGQADTDLKGSQRDQIDVTIGKASPQEVRALDKRYSGLQLDDDMVELANILDMDEPDAEE